MIKLTDEEKISLLRDKRFKANKWNATEKLLTGREKLRHKTLVYNEVPITLALQVKFRRSVFGKFMDFFNYQQNQTIFFNQNKLHILKSEMKEWDALDLVLFDEDNNATDYLMDYLEKAVDTVEKIDWDYLYETLTSLRLTFYDVNVVDYGLRKFRNLKVLVLDGNWIRYIFGYVLPRKLEFLELFGNQICSLQSFSYNPPRLIHIGLARNKITEMSYIHLLSECPKFSQMRTLDFSDNDICDLIVTLEALKPLQTLTGLCLEGNPCSVVASYKDAILMYLPSLISLDHAEIIKRDRKIKKEENIVANINRAAVVFTCHRIMGLPPPSKTKGIQKMFHFEIKLPLLEKLSLKPKIKLPPTKPGKKSRSSSKSKKKGKGSKKGKGPYDAPNEYDEEYELNNKAFKTNRFPYAKIMQLPEEALVIDSPENDLTAIRDTFRSIINVKLIYQEIQPPQKEKKGGKKDKKKDKDSKKGKGKDKKSKSGKDKKSKPEKDNEPPKEEILKKVTLADFYCELQQVNWSDKTVDFHWADHKDSKPNAHPVEGSLRAIKYVENKKKASKKASKKSQKSDEEGVFKIPSKQFVPPMFTCQVGFGLYRNFSV